MTDSRLLFANQQSALLRGNVEARLPSSDKDSDAVPMLPGISSISWDSASHVVHCTPDQLFEELLRLRDDERERVGHELHDSAGQLLLYLQLSVARLRSLESTGGHGELIDEIQATTRQIASEIRSLAFLNHPMPLPVDGLSPALQGLVEGFGKRTGYRVTFEARGDMTHIDAASSLALLRIGQEALVNIHRHARASAVEMQLTSDSGRLRAGYSRRRHRHARQPGCECRRGRRGHAFPRRAARRRVPDFERSSGDEACRQAPCDYVRKCGERLGLNQLVADRVPNQVGRRP